MQYDIKLIQTRPCATTLLLPVWPHSSPCAFLTITSLNPCAIFLRITPYTRSFAHTEAFWPVFSPALEHGQAKAHFSRGDALSSRGVHMKEQENIKECPRIHCSVQCEDNLALMENLDQRPGLHNCTFPNKHYAIWRVGQTSGLPRPVPVRGNKQPHSFHLAMFSISMSA